LTSSSPRAAAAPQWRARAATPPASAEISQFGKNKAPLAASLFLCSLAKNPLRWVFSANNVSAILPDTFGFGSAEPLKVTLSGSEFPKVLNLLGFYKNRSQATGINSARNFHLSNPVALCTCRLAAGST
jgi:hypothetical protein